MVNQYTELRAPYPGNKVTTILPKPQFQDIRKPESTIQVKRFINGGRKVYTNTTDTIQLTLPFLLTRQKSLELEAFLRSYQSADIQIDLYDGSRWKAKLTGRTFGYRAVDRYNVEHGLTGKDLIETTLTFSALRLN